MFITIPLASVFETVTASLFQPDTHQTRTAEALQALKNFHAEILRRRHTIVESHHVFIQIRMVEWLNDLPRHVTVQIAKMRDHARARINRPGDGYLHDIVVSVPIRVVTLPIDALIFGFV